MLRSSDTGLGGAASHTHPNELQIPAATRNESNIHVIRIDQRRLLLPDHVRHPLTHGNGAASAHPPRARLVRVRVRVRGRGRVRVRVIVTARVRARGRVRVRVGVRVRFGEAGVGTLLRASGAVLDPQSSSHAQPRKPSWLGLG